MTMPMGLWNREAIRRQGEQDTMTRHDPIIYRIHFDDPPTHRFNELHRDNPLYHAKQAQIAHLRVLDAEHRAACARSIAEEVRVKHGPVNMYGGPR
jgi:hypothetical protein